MWFKGLLIVIAIALFIIEVYKTIRDIRAKATAKKIAKQNSEDGSNSDLNKSGSE